MIKFLLLCGLNILLLATESESICRVGSHICIKDFQTAEKECTRYLQQYPNSTALKKIYVDILSKNHKPDQAISIAHDVFKEDQDQRLIESISWGFIEHYHESSQLYVMASSLLCAHQTDDIRASRLIMQGLYSTNSLVRNLAVKLSPKYKDPIIFQNLKELLSIEKVWFVKLEIIKAIGAMGFTDSKYILKQLIDNPRSSHEEVATAISAIVQAYDGIDTDELTQLLASPRAGLRELACNIISHLCLTEKIGMISELLDDQSPSVRIAALNAFYFIGLETSSSKDFQSILKCTEDVNPAVSLTAAWIICPFFPQKALKVIKDKIFSTSNYDVKRFAANILGKTGRIGISVAKEVKSLVADPFIHANIAVGQLGSGCDDAKNAVTLHSFLSLNREKLMFDFSLNPFFKVLGPSRVCHIPQISQYPELVDKAVRLEILGYLTILKHPKAKDAIKNFLECRSLDLSFEAATILFEECGEQTLSILYELLKSENKRHIIQIALIITMFDKDKQAIEILQKIYNDAPKSSQIEIISALGQVGNKDSIPFLLTLLEEPYQTVKVLAASSLIQCVYH